MELEGIENDLELQELALKAVEITTESSIKGDARESLFDLFGAIRKVLVRATAGPPSSTDARIVGALRVTYQEHTKDTRSDDEDRSSRDEQMDGVDASERYATVTSRIIFPIFMHLNTIF